MKTTTKKVEKVELALSRGEFEESANLLNGLVHFFNHARWKEEKANYWRAIKQIVNAENPAFFGKTIPTHVTLTIWKISETLTDNLEAAYMKTQRELGFLPIRINGETDPMFPHLPTHWAKEKVRNSIMRRLTNAFKSGGWDGEMRSAPMFFNQPVLDAPDFTEVFE